jgi:hypothetical protein
MCSLDILGMTLSKHYAMSSYRGSSRTDDDDDDEKSC